MYVKIDGKTTEYQVVRRRGMKNIRMRMKDDGTILVSAPYGVPRSMIEEALRKSMDALRERKENLDEGRLKWLDFVQKQMEGVPAQSIRHYGEDIVAGKPFEAGSIYDGLPIVTTKAEFQKMFQECLANFQSVHPIEIFQVTLRKMKTRWGSCRPSTGRMTFNALLLYVPGECARYVIYHELCHYLELNHSGRFWAQVERYVPDYRRMEKMLRYYGAILINHRMLGEETLL